MPQQPSPDHPLSLTRRQFNRRALGLGIAALSPAAVGFAAQAARQTGGPYIDIHTHLSQVHTLQRALSADEMLRWMDGNNVEKAIVLPLVSPKAWGYVITTDHVLKQTEPHRDRLVPFCAIDPRTTFNSRTGGLLDTLRRYKEAGAKGFGEHKVGIAIDDPANMRLFEACAELNLPVLFHLDNVRNFDRPGLPGLEKVLKTFPENNFIGHAQGWWASISGGLRKEQMQRYPDDPVQPGGAIDRLMDRHDNLYGDLSAGSGANAIARDPEFGLEFLIRRADRLLFGTDKLMPEQNIRQFDLYASLDLPERVRAKIFRENAQRLLDLN